MKLREQNERSCHRPKQNPVRSSKEKVVHTALLSVSARDPFFFSCILHDILRRTEVTNRSSSTAVETKRRRARTPFSLPILLPSSPPPNSSSARKDGEKSLRPLPSQNLKRYYLLRLLSIRGKNKQTVRKKETETPPKRTKSWVEKYQQIGEEISLLEEKKQPTHTQAKPNGHDDDQDRKSYTQAQGQEEIHPSRGDKTNNRGGKSKTPAEKQKPLLSWCSAAPHNKSSLRQR